MPTDLIATTSELSHPAQQLVVAAKPAEQGSRSGDIGGSLRIDIAVSIEVSASGCQAHLTGSIALRVNAG